MEKTKGCYKNYCSFFRKPQFMEAAILKSLVLFTESVTKYAFKANYRLFDKWLYLGANMKLEN